MASYGIRLLDEVDGRLTIGSVFVLGSFLGGSFGEVVTCVSFSSLFSSWTVCNEDSSEEIDSVLDEIYNLQNQKNHLPFSCKCDEK